MSGDNDMVTGQQPPRFQSGVDPALADKAALLQATLDGAQHGLCMFNADGRIVAFNKRYIDLMALPANDLIGMSALDLFRLRKAAGNSITILTKSSPWFAAMSRLGAR